MTTGINIGTDDAAQLDYVARLVSADAAAIAVDTGTTFTEVPAGVLAAGNALGLPVLEVPPSTPFIAIARVVVDALKADELRSVQRVVDEQEVLARATLKGGIPGVVSALADCLSAAVIVADTDGTILAAGGGGQERLTAVLAEAVRTATSNRQAGYVTTDGDAFVTVQKLRAAQPVRGHLAVRTTHPMSNADRLLVAHAVSLISIALEKPAQVVDAEQRLRRAVTHEMVCGTGTVDSGMLRYFDFDPQGEVVVVVLTGAGPTLAAEQALDRLLATAGPYLMTPVGDEMVIVSPPRAGGASPRCWQDSPRNRRSAARRRQRANPHCRDRQGRGAGAHRGARREGQPVHRVRSTRCLRGAARRSRGRRTPRARRTFGSAG